MEVSHRTGKKYEKQKKDIDTLVDNSIKPYPFLKDSSIEKESLNLLDSYSQDIGEKINPPFFLNAYHLLLPTKHHYFLFFYKLSET